jgi:hypothetical protein
MAAAIEALIEQAVRWRAEHKAAGRHIETAACNIRIKALQDALATFEK